MNLLIALKLLVFFPSFSSSTTAAAETPIEASTEAYNGDVEYYIAAYPYESNEGGDLSFGAGEMVMVIKKEGEWWTGTIGNRTGMFPSNYVQKADVGSNATAATTTASVDATSLVLYLFMNFFNLKLHIICLSVCHS